MESTARGNNPLYRHGFLRVSDDRRHLSHADGTPFLWIGDTAWAGPHRASDADWAAYLRDRVAKRFTLVQVGPAPDWAGPTDPAGNLPIEGGDARRPVPAFWQGWERKVRAANEAGLAVLVSGLMEPVSRYPSAEHATVFARWLAARLHGDMVVLSPSFDSPAMPLGDAVGAAVREATRAHLLTQHPGTPTGQPGQIWTEAYFDRDYLDFAGVQTGHNRGDREISARQAIEWNLRLYRREPRKPVVNLEAMYDTEGRGREGSFSGEEARSLGWLSMLSGACGYTYGSDVWQWRTDPAQPEYWRRAMGLASSSHMTHLRDFLARIPWWRLAPSPERISGQPPAWSRRVAAATTPDGRLMVAYFPAQARVTVDLRGMRLPLRIRWFDPRAGRFDPRTATVREAGDQSVEPPAPGDWALLIEGPRR
ncbi:MAG TPA: DUF4038 domain-containing protein [Chthonomonadales bacterium]|nr:DUF4038 domain-containing protein [Chthonomonadales bacterium]